MTLEVEAHFRESERRLDSLLQRDQQTIMSRGIEVVDRSERRYHYKNQHLSWSHQFEARRPRGSKIEKVRVTLTVLEGDPMGVRLWKCAEVFQIGQSPHWQKTDERVIPLQELLRAGMATTIVHEVEECLNAAEGAG